MVGLADIDHFYATLSNKKGIVEIKRKHTKTGVKYSINGHSDCNNNKNKNRRGTKLNEFPVF